MIEVEIIKSPLPEFLGKRIYYKNFLTIGDQNADVALKSDGILSFHLFLKIMNKECHCYPNINIEHFLLNQKRTTTPVLLNINDNITIQDYTLCLIKFEKGPIISRQENLENSFYKMRENSPGLHLAIHFISKEFGIT